MEGPPTPAEGDEASIPTEHERNVPAFSAGNRKAAKRTFPFDLKADEIKLALPQAQDESAKRTFPFDLKADEIQLALPPTQDEVAKCTFPFDLKADEIQLTLPQPQDEYIPKATKPQLDPIIKSSLVVNDVIDLCSDRDDDSTGTDAIVCTYTISSLLGKKRTPIATATAKPATKRGSPNVAMALLPPADHVDDAADRADSDPVTDVHPGRRASRWHWTPLQEAQLASAITNTPKKKRGRGKEYNLDWVAISALLPGRTRVQCHGKWRGTVDPSIQQGKKRTGRFTEDEDTRLKDAVKTHGQKDWVAIAALVPGRTQKQCQNRWYNVLDARGDLIPGRTGKWTEDESIKLKNAVQKHGNKDWAVVAALVPEWGKEDRIDWVAVAALIPGRTKRQCYDRWNDVLDPSLDRRANGRDRWDEVEDSTLKDAVHTHGGKDWVAIAALVPGRTKNQCYMRWYIHVALDPSIDPMTSKRTGTWDADENNKLKDAVHTHGNSWTFIAALVPGRTKRQCVSRWRESQGLNKRRTVREEELNKASAL
jgi:hypothetical protein